MEQANYAAAVEQELAKSILRISTVKHARVHLALPQQSVFVRDRTPPKACRDYTLPGRNMDASQVNAIINLVASSVPYLNPTDVSVVDSLGNLLSDTSQENPLGMTSAQLRHKQQLEDTYRNRIYQLLGPIYGEDNVRAQVDVELDFTKSKVLLRLMIRTKKEKRHDLKCCLSTGWRPLTHKAYRARRRTNRLWT